MFWTEFSDWTPQNIIIRIVVSILLGAIIGIDRGAKRRGGGARTTTTVCLGATLIMLMEQYLMQIFPEMADMTRMAAQVVSGVGFLGAGTILVAGRQIKGLTSAAGIWFSACAGLAVGIGFLDGAAWNFIIWGLYFAILLLVEKSFLLKQLDRSKVLSRVYLLFMVVISFVIFNATNMTEAFQYIGGMFGAGGVPLVSAEALYYLRSYAVIFLIAIIGATPIPKLVAGKSKIAQYVEPVFLLVLLVLVTAYLVDGSFNPFLYFRF